MKKARRLMRARAFQQGVNGKTILVPVYDELIDLVDDAQFEFEDLQREVNHSQQAFSRSDEIAGQFHKMDVYLGELITEYEHERPGLDAEGSRKGLDQFPRLRDFLDRSKSSAFRSDIVVAFHQVEGLIRDDLLNCETY